MKLVSQCIRSSRTIRSYSGQRNHSNCKKTLTATNAKNRIFSNRALLAGMNTTTGIINTENVYLPSFQSSVLNHRQFSDEASDKNDSGKENIDISKFTKEIEIKLPDLVEEHKAKIVKWYKQEGDIIQPNDTICDIETELFTFEYQVEDECLGLMKEILLHEGEETNDIDSPICIVLHEEEEETPEKESDDDHGDKKENEVK